MMSLVKGKANLHSSETMTITTSPQRTAESQFLMRAAVG